MPGFRHWRCASALLLAASVLVSPARAADLLDIFREAQANDAAYASARASLEAGRERLPQGRSLILPSVNASANSTYSGNNITQLSGGSPTPFDRNFHANAWTVTLTQPVYRWQNWIQYEEAGYQVMQAE